MEDKDMIRHVTDAQRPSQLYTYSYMYISHASIISYSDIDKQDNFFSILTGINFVCPPSGERMNIEISFSKFNTFFFSEFVIPR